MSLPPATTEAAGARFVRFRPLFDAVAFALDKMHTAFEEHGDVIKVGQGPERNLSLLVPLFVLGKGRKTCSAARHLCWLGYGEDAAILVRANLNLLINLGYIAGDSDPVRRADEFLAYSYAEREKFFRLGYGEKMPIGPPVPADQLAAYVKAWKDASIETKAQQAGLRTFHYARGYRYFSSLEHSDAFALNTLLGDWNEVGPVIRGEDDQGVDLALFIDFLVACDLTLAMLQFYRIDHTNLASEFRAKMQELEEWDTRENNKGLPKAQS
jgi:hypothetical protein